MSKSTLRLLCKQSYLLCVRIATAVSYSMRITPTTMERERISDFGSWNGGYLGLSDWQRICSGLSGISNSLLTIAPCCESMT